MQKLQESIFSIVKATNLSSSVFNYLRPTEEFSDKTPLGGILRDSRYGWLALGPKFCVVDLKTGLKTASWTFGALLNNCQCNVTDVVELPTPLTENSQQLVISIESETLGGLICVFHINGSHILRCIQTEAIITNLTIFDSIPDGVFSCFDGIVIAGTRNGEIFAFDLNRESLLQALKYTTQGCENLIHNETNSTGLTFLPLNSISEIEEQREMALENDDHISVLLNENSFIEGQYIFRNPDGTVCMKAKRDHIRVSTLQYIPQLGSVAVGYNFGAFQIWNLITLELELTSQVNIECLPVTHFGFQEPCDDPRAFCYLWVVYSAIDRFEEEEFPLAVMYSLTYHAKRMLRDSKYLYQEFLSSTLRFQVELNSIEGVTSPLIGGRCVACHTYSIPSTLGDEGEDSVLNICQLVWECWGVNLDTPTHYGMLLFDLDQWYKDQMPGTQLIQNNAFMSAAKCGELPRDAAMLDVALVPRTLAQYAHAARLEEHFYPNSLQYNCVCLSTSEACIINTAGVQRDIISTIDETGPTALVRPARLYRQCVDAGLTPLYVDSYINEPTIEEQRYFLLSVALEARLSRFLKRCAHDWATGSHSGAGCTLTLLLDWCWKRAINLKQNARELTAPLFTSSSLPDRNVCRCLEHCVRQLTQLTNLLDSVLTKCCNLVIPDALSEIEEKYKGIGTVALYFQVVQWFLNVGLLPERQDNLPYPCHTLLNFYRTRRLKLHRLHQNSTPDESAGNKSCPLLYIDQLIDNECGGETIHEMWRKSGSECDGLYPPPSLYSLLRLYLLPDIAEEHKHSLVLYLLVDYSMVYDELRYETVIRRLMQFPTMFGLSNTAIKATQAFWHLDHRDFDFALDQLQCLTGNTLSDWQHKVVLSALLAQKKTQAALHYLHVRKPAPIQSIAIDKNENAMNISNNKVNDHDKLEDWQSCCNLYLARGLVFEALDVIRSCAQNVRSLDEKVQVLNFFFKGCRNTGQLSKILQIILLPFEEEVFTKYLQNCNDQQTSDILVMYYLQQARYVEAQQYNSKLRQGRSTVHLEKGSSLDSLLDMGLDRDSARDLLVDVACSSLPSITNKVVQCALNDQQQQYKGSRVLAPRPMSVCVQAKSPKNTFTYKSTFIHDTIENASETWLNRPKTQRGIKRALNIEETPFICTPKLTRTRSLLHSNVEMSEFEGQTPSKRPRLDVNATPRTPKNQTLKVNEKLTKEIESFLEMPDTTPEWKIRDGRSVRESTPHSILKVKRSEPVDNASPVDSRYLGESEEEIIETSSVHTHYSDSKHLRFTIPSGSESSTSSEPTDNVGVMESTSPLPGDRITELGARPETPKNRYEKEQSPFESPPEKVAPGRPNYKDVVKARVSMFLTLNSSLSDDQDISIETLSDIPITLLNSTYHENLEIYNDNKMPENSMTIEDVTNDENPYSSSEHPKVLTTESPRARRSIRRVETDEPKPQTIGTRSRSAAAERQDSPALRRGYTRSRSVTPERQDSPVLRRRSATRSRSVTPERQDSPILHRASARSRTATPERQGSPVLRRGYTRSRTVTPDRQDSPVLRQPSTRSLTPERVVTSKTSPKLDAIPEQPQQEIDIEPQIESTKLLRLPRSRSRSRTPERAKLQEEAKLEVIAESPKNETAEDIQSPSQSPRRYGLRSRSRTPEVECAPELVPESPRSLRSRSKTPERDTKLLSLKTHTIEKPSKTKKSLSRIVLEANTFSKAVVNKTEPMTESPGMDMTQEKSVLHDSSDSIMECTPVKDSTEQNSNLLDVSFSPIVNKSVLISSAESSYGDKDHQSMNENTKKAPTKTLNFTMSSETYYEKSVLKSCTSSAADNTDDDNKPNVEIVEPREIVEEELQCKVSITEDISSVTNKSVLKDVSSLITSDSDMDIKDENEEAVPEQILENVSNEEDIVASRLYEQQKHKIGEIEREIDEIEGTLSECEPTSDSDDQQLDEEDDEVEHSVEEEHSSTESSEDDEDDAIISVVDSSEDDQNDKSYSSSQSDQLQIVESVDIEVREKSLLAVATEEEKQSGNENDEKQGEPIEEPQVEYQNNVVISSLELEDESNAADPLNQANYSLMTDDNSMTEAENSEMKLSYSQDDGSDKKVDVAYENESAYVNEAVTMKETSPIIQETDEVYTTIELEKKTNEKEPDSEIETMEIEHKETDSAITTNEMEADVIPIVHDVVNVQTVEKEEIMEKKTAILTTPKETDITQMTEKEKNVPIESQEVTMTTNIKEQTVEEKLETEKVTEIEVLTEEIAVNETDVVDAVINVVPEPDKNAPANTEIKEMEIAVEKPKSPARTRRRAQSTSSNKSIDRAEVIEKKEKVTPSRKRTRSTSSQRSAGSKAESETKTTPESEISEPQSTDTPRSTRRGRRTPSSANRVITRRMSKELSKLEELSDESFSTTPRRSVSTGKDDNLSVASDESKLSKESAKSETSEVKLRRARRSILANVKPDLTVIPENSEETSSKSAKEDAISEYSKDRRLTRKQKAVMEKLLTPRPSETGAGRVRSRRSSTASNVSVISGSIEESPELPEFDVQPIDRISLLDKNDFKGSPDKEEMEKPASPSSAFSDISPRKRSRPSSALSEGRIQEKVSQPPRRLSVDIAKLQSEVESPASSPGRARRASFHRAVEAIHTPKGRRHSTDLKKSESGSTPASPVPSVDSDMNVTPSRRSRRRVASAQSNASAKSKE